MIQWNKYFDKIYLIHMAEMKDRYEKIKQELERVGIDIHSDYFSFKITTNNPMYKYIYTNNDFRHLNMPYVTNNVKNCSMAHYEVLKECQVMGYKRVLIMEDDITFLKDISKIKAILENMVNTDIILFDKWTFNKTLYKHLIDNEKINNYYAKYSNDFSSCACYSLNQKGINSILKVQETFFLPQDFCVNDNCNQNVTKAFAIQNIGIQKQYKTKQNDIDYNNKAYENIIDKKDYNL